MKIDKYDDCESCNDDKYISGYKNYTDQYSVYPDALGNLVNQLEKVKASGWVGDDDMMDTIINAYKSLAKNEKGDIVSKIKDSPKYVTNPFTNEEVPVYSEDEIELLDELDKIDGMIRETENWLETEADGEERVNLRKDLAKLEEEHNLVATELDAIRDEDGWSEIREKQKKLASEKEKVAKEKAKKAKVARKKKNDEKAKAKAKEDKRKAKIDAERKDILDKMPEEIQNLADDLFN